MTCFSIVRNVRSTANIDNYDIDILLPFRKDSISSLEGMFDYTFEKVRSNFRKHKNIEVYRKTKSIEVSFEQNGNGISFDIVPGREIDDYKNDKRFNLFVNSKNFWHRNSSFKIDTTLQRDITKNKPNERKVIRLLKRYNSENNLNIPKVIIEQSVILALSDENFGLYSSLTDNLLNSMIFLSEKLKRKQFNDWGNSSNNLLLKMSKSERIRASRLLITDVDKVENEEHYIKEIFEFE